MSKPVQNETPQTNITSSTIQPISQTTVVIFRDKSGNNIRTFNSYHISYAFGVSVIIIVLLVIIISYLLVRQKGKMTINNKDENENIELLQGNDIVLQNANNAHITRRENRSQALSPDSGSGRGNLSHSACHRSVPVKSMSNSSSSSGVSELIDSKVDVGAQYSDDVEMDERQEWGRKDRSGNTDTKSAQMSRAEKTEAIEHSKPETMGLGYAMDDT